MFSLSLSFIWGFFHEQLEYEPIKKGKNGNYMMDEIQSV